MSLRQREKVQTLSRRLDRARQQASRSIVRLFHIFRVSALTPGWHTVAVRSFAIGLIFLALFSVTVLSLRPGGLRQQLRFAARRLRIVLVLGGVYVAASTIARLVFQEGPVIDFGLPVLAAILAVAFLILGRDPAASTGK